MYKCSKICEQKKKLYLLLFIALKSWRQQNIHSRKVGNGTNMMGMGVIPYWGRQTMAPNKKQEDTYRHTPLLLFLHLTSGLRLLRHPTPPFNKRNNHNHPPRIKLQNTTPALTGVCHLKAPFSSWMKLLSPDIVLLLFLLGRTGVSFVPRIFTCSFRIVPFDTPQRCRRVCATSLPESDLAVDVLRWQDVNGSRRLCIRMRMNPAWSLNINDSLVQPDKQMNAMHFKDFQ